MTEGGDDIGSSTGTILNAISRTRPKQVQSTVEDDVVLLTIELSSDEEEDNVDKESDSDMEQCSSSARMPQQSNNSRLVGDVVESGDSTEIDPVDDDCEYIWIETPGGPATTDGSQRRRFTPSVGEKPTAGTREEKESWCQIHGAGVARFVVCL